jgi:hypothetical protein
MSWIQDPAKFRKLNGWMTIFWIVMIPVSIVTGWVQTVEYVAALSIYALVTGHLSTWQAARVEERQEKDDTEQLVHEIRQTQEEQKQTKALNGHR